MAAIGDGNILVWKRKAEEYLIAQAQASGGALTYTIVHPVRGCRRQPLGWRRCLLAGPLPGGWGNAAAAAAAAAAARPLLLTLPWAP